jgi:hypothetical protein
VLVELERLLSVFGAQRLIGGMPRERLQAITGQYGYFSQRFQQPFGYLIAIDYKKAAIVRGFWTLKHIINKGYSEAAFLSWLS